MLDHNLDYRAASECDLPLLWEMLTYAAAMHGPLEAAVARAQADAGLSLYLCDFGRRAGDSGVIALTEGEPVGAAWLRLENGPSPFRVATKTEPELAIGLRPSARGRGVGEALLRRVLDLAAASFPAVVLSVRSENPSVRLYERHGFRVLHHVTNRVGGDSLVMRVDFPVVHAETSPSRRS